MRHRQFPFFIALLLASTLVLASSPDAKAQQQRETGTPQFGLRIVGEYGTHKLLSPETAIWDERADVYLVSNVNGKLQLPDDNGFITRIAPDGRILALKWIDGANRNVTLHAPKDMLLTDAHLVVADVGAVHWFARDTGEPAGSVVIPDSYMLNGLARGPDDSVFVTDTGGSTEEEPGAIFRIDSRRAVSVVARGPELDKPNGIIASSDGFLVAPFGRHADTLYRLTPDGIRKPARKLPGTQLDGLLRLPNGALVVTSWQNEAVYRIPGNGDAIDTLIDDIKAPAQIGYDAKRGRLLVPLPKKDRVMVFGLPEGA